MEVNLCQRNKPNHFSPFPKLLSESSLPSQSHSFCFRTLADTKISLDNHLRAISLRWRFQLQEASKDQLSNKHYYVHVVQERETLTSISRQYGVSIYSLVIANKDILETDPLYKGQHIKIPSSIVNTQVIRDRYQLQEKIQSYLNELCNHKNLFMLASTRLPPVRTIVSIVFIPLVVFCIQCIIGASYARISGILRLKNDNKSAGEHHELRNGHWRSALHDIRDPDGLNSKSTADSVSQSHEDKQQKMSIEDLSHAYKKLDKDYAKFLSECGLS